ncbi:hypothetical protein KKB55_07490 [Myxococcota bacterium]|nr:hypothetical protein [Myxococcota bacterium]MBU1897599.1 hypothetical protein [Myxococcota bacterium]
MQPWVITARRGADGATVHRAVGAITLGAAPSCDVCLPDLPPQALNLRGAGGAAELRCLAIPEGGARLEGAPLRRGVWRPILSGARVEIGPYALEIYLQQDGETRSTNRVPLQALLPPSPPPPSLSQLHPLEWAALALILLGCIAMLSIWI